MSYSDTLAERIAARPKRQPTDREVKALTVMPSDAPAPHVQAEIASKGAELFAQSLAAWERRVQGERIVDIAHSQGLSIETAKQLIREAHAAVTEDMKETLAVNRQLDLDRLDGLLKTWYPLAKGGDEAAANVTLRVIQQRAKLCGSEPLPDAGRQQPQNVLVWIQAQLPNISKLVDSLPVE